MQVPLTSVLLFLRHQLSASRHNSPTAQAMQANIVRRAGCSVPSSCLIEAVVFSGVIFSSNTLNDYLSMVFLCSVLRKSGVITSKQLYKQLMRGCEKLPKDAQKHYKHSVRQSFLQHVNESDPERVKQIIDRALEDSEWILNKYSTQKL